MEQVLKWYAKPYDADYPVVCFDERPCFLIGDCVEPIARKPGKVAKQNYSYTKHGSCCVLACIEPKTGKRLAHVRKRRTKKEFTKFMQNLAKRYPNAKKIIVILDNLNTHNFSSFYEHLPADQAAALADRFDFVHTPKSASWLNMIEIEFSALARQCLNRRIDKISIIGKEVITYFNEREKNKVLIDWQFTRKDARQKMKRHYQKVNTENI